MDPGETSLSFEAHDDLARRARAMVKDINMRTDYHRVKRRLRAIEDSFSALEAGYRRLKADHERLIDEYYTLEAEREYNRAKGSLVMQAAIEADYDSLMVILRLAADAWSDPLPPPGQEALETDAGSQSDPHHSDAYPPAGPARRPSEATPLRRNGSGGHPAVA